MDHPLDEINFAGAVPQMDVYDSCFPGQHTRHPGIRRDPGKLFKGGLGGAVIGNGDFSHADHLIQHHNILHQTAGQGVDRNLIGAGIGVCGDPFLFKRMGFGQQGGGVSSDAVRTDAADHRGDSVPDQVAQGGLWSSRVEAAFAASADNVFMTVNEARNSSHAIRVDFHNFKASAEIRFQVFTDGGNRPAKDENILFPGIFRLINFGVSEDHNHCHICSCFPV